MKPTLTAFAAGLLFAVGLVVGGMTMPSKVIGFLDFTGAWDPSLMLVMGGAVLTHTLLYRVIARRKVPVFDVRFWAPARRVITAPLVIGSAIFGIGWGLSGFCPGPGIVSLATGGAAPWVFVAAMLLGFVAHEGFERWRARLGRAAPPPVEVGDA